ncbi:MAG: hypothetical protein JXR70_10540 [Spirochaetales bacterium]|nr:hypothetical protein [Spirochaetales bacterium]
MAGKKNETTSTKKTAAKTKSSPKKSTVPKQSVQQKRLLKELQGLLPQIDEEGLIFLLKQAQVLVHNQQIDKINREIVEYEEKKRDNKAVKSGQTKSKKQNAEAIVSIEDTGKKNFILIFNGARKFLDLEEMRSLVKISHGADGSGEGILRLYKWLARNRQDILIDSAVAKASHPAMELLYKFIMRHYTLKN